MLRFVYISFTYDRTLSAACYRVIEDASTREITRYVFRCHAISLSLSIYKNAGTRGEFRDTLAPHDSHRASMREVSANVLHMHMREIVPWYRIKCICIRKKLIRKKEVALIRATSPRSSVIYRKLPAEILQREPVIASVCHW